MATQELPRSEWETYFDFFSKNTDGCKVEVEVSGATLGSQIQEKGSMLDGLVYDSKDDTFYVHTPFLDHQIVHPRKIFTYEENGMLSSIEIVDAEELKHIIKIKEPIRLQRSAS